MLKFTRLLTTAATVASLAAFAAGTAGVAMAAPVAPSAPAKTAAPADPPKGTSPQSYDVVGVGSNTTQFVLDQMSVNYNASVGKKHSATDPYFYSFDALPPGVTTAPANTTYYITPKAGCSSKTVRPNGSGAGLKALDANTFDGKTGHYCIDFGRSSSGRSATSPKFGSGGVAYVAFAKDAVTWAARSSAKGGTDAPKSLSDAQLKAIFSCRDTNWDQVGGKNAAIKVYLPQPGSGTLSFWEKVMGITTLGGCVSQAPEENEGTYAGFNSPNAIFIFSVGSYLAQEYRSMSCSAKAPAKGQNEFGCDQVGVLALGTIDGISPVTAANSTAVTNPKFPAAYYRTLYDILRYTTETKDHILQRLEPFFSKTGYLCANKTAQAETKAYGFVVDPACGSAS
jgi:ABC-type phosphate transport system substrate-binding protein